jgi:protein phosphatase 2C family protein 2/3
VIAVPDIREHQLTDEDDFVVIASDGLWDVFETQEAATFARRQLGDNRAPDALKRAADALCAEVKLRRAQCDNTTVLLVAL